MVRVPTHRLPTHPGEMLLKEFIDINKSRPTEITNAKLASWLGHQVNISKKRIAIMKNDIIYNIWQNLHFLLDQ